MTRRRRITVNRQRYFLVAGALSLAMVAATAAMAAAQSSAPESPSPHASAGPTVMETVAGATLWPPDSDPLGVPYEDWAARHWTWLGTAPADQDPGASDNCGVGQSGDVFFIPHTFPGNTLATTCTVRSDQAILASGGGAFCDRASGWGENEEELRACIEADLGVFSNVSVTIDGEAVPDIERFWVISPMHDVTFPADNAFQIAPGTTQAVGAGWFVMVSDLTPGTHTIVVHDDIDIPDDDEGPLPAEVIATVEVVDAAAVETASPG